MNPTSDLPEESGEHQKPPFAKWLRDMINAGAGKYVVDTFSPWYDVFVEITFTPVELHFNREDFTLTEWARRFSKALSGDNVVSANDNSCTLPEVSRIMN